MQFELNAKRGRPAYREYIVTPKTQISSEKPTVMNSCQLRPLYPSMSLMSFFQFFCCLKVFEHEGDLYLTSQLVDDFWSAAA
mmetsp:Transcript_11754/g.17954  ORF Transcript_11754/g.17954 Transcript_11754/m.17954 type:complete len:82 (+) Transcript_11754:448-693(+)